MVRCPILALSAVVIILAGCGSSATVPQTVVSTSTASPTPTSPTPTSTTPTSTSATPTSTASTTAASAGQQATCGSLFRGFISHLTAHGVGCPVATTVASGWLAQVQAGQNPGQVIGVQGDAPYSCAGRFQAELAAVLCERNDDPADARVVFLAHP